MVCMLVEWAENGSVCTIGWFNHELKLFNLDLRLEHVTTMQLSVYEWERAKLNQLQLGWLIINYVFYKSYLRCNVNVIECVRKNERMDERAIYKESKWDTFNKVSKSIQVTLINKWSYFILKIFIISKTMWEMSKF